MTAKIIQFIPRSRRGDPDFPGIPEVAHFAAVKCECDNCHYNATLDLLHEVLK